MGPHVQPACLRIDRLHLEDPIAEGEHAGVGIDAINLPTDPTAKDATAPSRRGGAHGIARREALPFGFDALSADATAAAQARARHQRSRPTTPHAP